MWKSNLHLHTLAQQWVPTYAREWGIGRNPSNHTRVGKGEHSQTGPLLHFSEPDYVALRRPRPRRDRNKNWCVHKWEADDFGCLTHQQWYRVCLKCGRSEKMGD